MPNESAPLPLGFLQSRPDEAVRLLRILSNEKRLQVLCALVAGERSAGDLAAITGLSPSALSQHLAMMKAEGLLETRRAGQVIFYRIDDPRLPGVLSALDRSFAA